MSACSRGGFQWHNPLQSSRSRIAYPAARWSPIRLLCHRRAGRLLDRFPASMIHPEKTGRAWRKKRKETSHCGYGKKAGGVAASPLGQRRSVPTIAQQQPNDSCGSRVNQDRKTKVKIVPGREKTKCLSRVPVTASNARPTFSRLRKTRVANQVAAPAELRTPNLHRAQRPLLESADGSMATVATRRTEKQLVQ